MQAAIYSIITGATSGIGKAMAYKLAKEGYNLIVIGRDLEKLESLCEELETKFSIKIIPYQMDVKNRKSIEKLGTWLEVRQIGIEIFINNAGVGSFGHFNQISIEEDMSIIDTNIGGVTLLLKVVMKYILKGGTIVQVASTAAFAPGPYMSVYYASKAYVLSLSIAIREELKKNNVQVSVLCPGPTSTAFQHHAKMKKAGFTKGVTMTAKEVVEIAYREMLKGKSIIIPGVKNKLAVLGMQSLPINLRAKCVAQTQDISR